MGICTKEATLACIQSVGFKKDSSLILRASLLSDLTGVTTLTGGHSNPEDDALYFIDTSSQIKKFDSGADSTYEWHSKQYKVGRPINMAVAQSGSRVLFKHYYFRLCRKWLSSYSSQY